MNETDLNTNKRKIKPDKVFLNYILFLLILLFFFIYHLLFSRIWFRIPVEECEEGFCETISELCIFNPFRDKTLENRIRKMVDFLREQDKVKAFKILEELKKDKQIAPEVIDDLVSYKKIRSDVAPYLGKIKARDYFKKKNLIVFAFYVFYDTNSPYYEPGGENISCCGVAYLDSDTHIIKEFVLIH